MNRPNDDLDRTNTAFEDLLDLACQLTEQPLRLHVRIDPHQLGSHRSSSELAELRDRLARYGADMEPVHRALASAASGAPSVTETPIPQLDAAVLLAIVSSAREAASALALQLSQWPRVRAADGRTYRAGELA